MAETILKVVKVFIGSPGGLEDERQAAKRIVDEINQSHSEHWECQIKLVGWEATLPGYNRAQSLINQDLDKCEYFVGVLWDNWGSRPEDGDGQYSSGFEEEFERAKDRIERGLMKDMALFFKDIKEVQLKNLHPTYKRVVRFREECARRRKPLFKEFKETSDFEPLFRAKISEIGWQESGHLQTSPKESLEPEQPAKAIAKEQSATEATGRLIETSPFKFVTELLQRSSEWDATSSFEIARFRLIATSIGRSGNDELNLGNHDANLIFIKRNHFDFSDQEVRALAKAGIAGFDFQNVPLWHWIAKQSGPMGGLNIVQFSAARLFTNPNSIPTDVLERCLTLKSDIVRKEAAKLLNSRRAIDTTAAERLMTDSDPEARLIAVETLAELGKAPDESTIKKALIFPKASGLFGMALGNAADDSYYIKYKQMQLSKLSYEELRKKVDICSVYDHIEIAVMNTKFTRKNIREIRTNLDDGFKAHFEKKINALASSYGVGDDAKILTDTRDLEKYLRTRLTSETLDTLCAFGDRQDLGLVQKTLDENEIDYSISALQYLSRFGDWSDKDRILSFSVRHSHLYSLLSGAPKDRYKPIAAALYAIGKSRLPDLLKLEIDIGIRRALIAMMSQKDIRSLGDDVVMYELNNKDDQFRKILALKCTQAMKQTRICKLLNRYINQDHERYYNSVHWLDLGSSMHRDAVRNVSKFELTKFQ